MAECLAGLLFLSTSATSGVVSSIAGRQALSCLENCRAATDGVSSMRDAEDDAEASMRDAADDADASGSSVWQRCSMKATSAVADAAASLSDISAGVAVNLDSHGEQKYGKGFRWLPSEIQFVKDEWHKLLDTDYSNQQCCKMIAAMHSYKFCSGDSSGTRRTHTSIQRLLERHNLVCTSEPKTSKRKNQEMDESVVSATKYLKRICSQLDDEALGAQAEAAYVPLRQFAAAALPLKDSDYIDALMCKLEAIGINSPSDLCKVSLVALEVILAKADFSFNDILDVKVIRTEKL